MRKHVLIATGAVILALCGGLGVAATDQPDTTIVRTDSPGQILMNTINEAWAAEYDEATIEAIYDPAVIMMVDTDVLAADRDEIATVIRGALNVGNTFTQVGSVIEYEDDDGDLYIAAIVEVVGVAHQKGDPLIGFYRIRDGKVIRHIFMYASEY